MDSCRVLKPGVETFSILVSESEEVPRLRCGANQTDYLVIFIECSNGRTFGILKLEILTATK